MPGTGKSIRIYKYRLVVWHFLRRHIILPQMNCALTTDCDGKNIVTSRISGNIFPVYIGSFPGKDAHDDTGKASSMYPAGPFSDFGQKQLCKSEHYAHALLCRLRRDTAILKIFPGRIA